jgi:hypothetical protein
MVIVLIHWRIKPTDEAVAQFFDHWTTTATIADKTDLAGEFLSAPLPAERFPFRVDDLTLGPGGLNCRHFLNVALWKSWESFYEQVGKNMNDDRPLEPFEADRRTRIVLEPRHFRLGQWSGPESGTSEEAL